MARKKDDKKYRTFFLNENHEIHATKSYVRKERELSKLRFQNLRNLYEMLGQNPILLRSLSFSPHYGIDGKKDGKTLKLDRGFGAYMEFHFSDDGLLIDAGGVMRPEVPTKRKKRRTKKRSSGGTR